MQRFFLIAWLLFPGLFAVAQPAHPPDTLAISVAEAEKLFLERNLDLIAQQYNVDINRALVQQARYWDNPILNTDQNIYDGKFFRHKTVNGQAYGQFYIQLMEVIRTAGKRNKQVQLAQDQVRTAGQQFADLMRNLRFVLLTDLHTAGQQLQTHAVYEKEITAMQQLAKGMDAQLQAGNISLKDNLRIKALLFSLQTEEADLQREITDTQKELHVLLQQQGDTIIAPVLPAVNLSVPSLSVEQLLDSALANRPDMQLAQTNIVLQQHNLSYQRALAVPDPQVGVEYDKANSYVPNYWGLAVSIPLPLLNRNQGNINAARASIRQASVGIQQAQLTINRDVYAAYNKLLLASKVLSNAPPELGEKYDRLLENMVGSYQHRQVSLIEFIDFFEAYKAAKVQQLQQQTNLRNAAAELNFTTATNVIPLQ